MLPALTVLVLCGQPLELPTTFAADEAKKWFRHDYEVARRHLDDVTVATLDDPSAQNVAELERALAAIEPFDPEVAEDARGRDVVLTAHVLLAREWASTDPERATQELNEAFAANDPDEVVATVALFSPELGGMANTLRPAHVESQPKPPSAGKPKGGATVVAVNDAPSEIAESPSKVGEGPSETAEKAGAGGGDSSAVEGPSKPDDVSSKPGGDSSAVEGPSESVIATAPSNGRSRHRDGSRDVASEPHEKRMLPRWAEFTGLGVGAALIITGGSLWSTDGKCRKLSQDLPDCPRIWESTPAGAVTVSFGAALLITSTVLLVIDERRTGNLLPRRVQLQPNGVLRF